MLRAVGRPSNTAERRAEIVDGLLEVMAKRGYEAATIAEIGRACGLTPGLIHYHFESKQEVLVALVEQLSARVEQRYSTRVARLTERTPRAELEALIDAHLERGDDADPRAVAAWVVIGAEALRTREVRVLYARTLERSYERLRELVSACLAGERQRARKSARIATAIIAAIEGAYRIGTAAPALFPAGFAAPMVHSLATALLGDRR
jgi:TetR/AcrR family transcriptional regulator, transcriptional repressor of bet genes